MNFIAFIVAGALSLNNTLPDVHAFRNKHYNANLPLTGFDCRAGVQARHSELLGKVLYGYDIEGQEYLGKFLVVDVASKDHAGAMEAKGLALDTDCEELVHRVGIFYLFSEAESEYPAAIVLPNARAAIPRVRDKMRLDHWLCGVDTECHWRVEAWVWQ